MARKPKQKNLENSRLLKEYASWIYCTECNKTVAYLCYVTYDLFDFEYTCNCGNHGKVFIEFEHGDTSKSTQSLNMIKNRLCCPNDQSPLLTIVDKNIKDWQYRIICNTCNTEFEVTNYDQKK